MSVEALTAPVSLRIAAFALAGLAHAAVLVGLPASMPVGEGAGTARPIEISLIGAPAPAPAPPQGEETPAIGAPDSPMAPLPTMPEHRPQAEAIPPPAEDLPAPSVSELTARPVASPPATREPASVNAPPPIAAEPPATIDIPAPDLPAAPSAELQPSTSAPLPLPNPPPAAAPPRAPTQKRPKSPVAVTKTVAAAHSSPKQPAPRPSQGRAAVENARDAGNPAAKQHGRLPTGTAAGPAGSGNANYGATVRGILQARANALGLEDASGVVSLRFAIGPNGQIIAHALTKTSGDAGIDRAILAMLARVRFPSPPGGAFTGQVQIRVQ